MSDKRLAPFVNDFQPCPPHFLLAPFILNFSLYGGGRRRSNFPPVAGSQSAIASLYSTSLFSPPSSMMWECVWRTWLEWDDAGLIGRAIPWKKANFLLLGTKLKGSFLPIGVVVACACNMRRDPWYYYRTRPSIKSWLIISSMWRAPLAFLFSPWH